MLDEFLKYAKMATHLFNVTQATNYDTATFNDPLLIWKKEMQMAKANATRFAENRHCHRQALQRLGKTESQPQKAATKQPPIQTLESPLRKVRQP